MKQRNRAAPWISIVAIVALAPASAEACSCAVPIAGNPPCERFWRADAVFAGRAVALEKVARNEAPGGGGARWPAALLRYTFEVDEGFRGADRGPVKVVTSSSGAACGADIKLGRRYFVYAHYSPETGELHTGLCSRTRRLARADEDLRYARRIAAGEEPTLIYGAALHTRRKARDDAPRPSPIVGARIRLEGPGGEELTVVTDAEGRFQAEVAAGGTYQVTAEWSDELPPAAAEVVTVQPGRCSPVELQARRLGSVSGR